MQLPKLTNLYATETQKIRPYVSYNRDVILKMKDKYIM